MSAVDAEARGVKGLQLQGVMAILLCWVTGFRPRGPLLRGGDGVTGPWGLSLVLGRCPRPWCPCSGQTPPRTGLRGLRSRGAVLHLGCSLFRWPLWPVLGSCSFWAETVRRPHSALQQPSPVSCPSPVFAAFRVPAGDPSFSSPVFLSAVSGVLLNSLTGFNFQSYDFQFF